MNKEDAKLFKVIKKIDSYMNVKDEDEIRDVLFQLLNSLKIYFKLVNSKFNSCYFMPFKNRNWISRNVNKLEELLEVSNMDYEDFLLYNDFFLLTVTDVEKIILSIRN